MISCFCIPNLGLIVAVLMIVTLVTIAVIGLGIFNLHRFLARNSPVKTDVLVVEGWIPDYAIAAAMKEFQNGEYKTLITIGAPMPRGAYLSSYKTFAELAAATLIALGFDQQKLQIVSTDFTPECRTQNAAIALKKHLEISNPHILSMNIFTFGPHARRTWLLFRRAFPDPMEVGIIAAQPLLYDAKSWWNSSEGVRTVVGELIAYLYRRFGG